MLELSYFLTVLLTVLISSTIGTVLLLKATVDGTLKRRAALINMVFLALTLPIAVPLAVGAVFFQVIHYFPQAGVMTLSQAGNFMFALVGSMVASLALCIFAAVSGIKKLPR